MKIYLQSVTGDLYLSSSGVWISDCEKAVEFTSSTAAVIHATKLRLASFVVTIRFGPSGRDLHIHIPEHCCHPTP